MKAVETIDCAPTWLAVVPLLIANLEAGTAEGKAVARAELVRMAKLADARVADLKQAALDHSAASLAYKPGGPV